MLKMSPSPFSISAERRDWSLCDFCQLSVKLTYYACTNVAQATVGQIRGLEQLYVLESTICTEANTVEAIDHVGRAFADRAEQCQESRLKTKELMRMGCGGS